MTSSTILLKTGSKATTWQPRVTQAQEEAITATALTLDLVIDYDQLLRYVNTGDLHHLATPTRDAIDRVVKHTKERMPNASQAKRIWPRKVAAVLLSV